MCETIRLKNGNDIDTVTKFQEYFDVDANKYLYDYYDRMLGDACLCQLNLQLFFNENYDGLFYYDCGDWWESS